MTPGCPGSAHSAEAPFGFHAPVVGGTRPQIIFCCLSLIESERTLYCLWWALFFLWPECNRHSVYPCASLKFRPVFLQKKMKRQYFTTISQFYLFCFFIHNIYTTFAVNSKNETHPNRDTRSDIQYVYIDHLHRLTNWSLLCRFIRTDPLGLTGLFQ